MSSARLSRSKKEKEKALNALLSRMMAKLGPAKAASLPFHLESDRPTLVRVGRHLLDPKDVASITSVSSRPGLFVIRLKSNPNPEFPIWAEEDELSDLVASFNIIGG